MVRDRTHRVIVTGQVPEATDAVVLIVNVEPPPVLTAAGLNEAVALEGKSNVSERVDAGYPAWIDGNWMPSRTERSGGRS